MVQKTRTDILNHLAERYNLHRYLEIGVQDKTQNFDKIQSRLRVGVDPDPKADAGFIMTSDHFFEVVHPWWSNENENPNMAQFDLIFIDGLHTAEQVKKDFENALKVLSPNGFIVLHDCNPLKEEHTIVPRPKPTGHWNGSCYKFAASLANIENIVRKMNGEKPNVCTVDIDNGCLVFHSYANKKITDYFPTGTYPDISWEHFDKNRKQLLNLISWDEFVKL